MNLRQIITEWFEYHRKMRWLKAINRELDRYNTLYKVLEQQRETLSSLIDDYNFVYPDSKFELGRKMK